MFNKEIIKLEKYMKDVHRLSDVFYRFVLLELQQRAIAPEAIDHFEKKVIPWARTLFTRLSRLDPKLRTNRA